MFIISVIVTVCVLNEKQEEKKHHVGESNCVLSSSHPSLHQRQCDTAPVCYISLAPNGEPADRNTCKRLKAVRVTSCLFNAL